MSKVIMGNGSFYGCLIEPQGVSAWWKKTAQTCVLVLSCSLLLNHLEPQSSKAATPGYFELFWPLTKLPLNWSPGYPIDGNRWSENQSINRYQSIKLVNWYRLVSVNRWSIDNHTKIVHRLSSIGTVPRNRRHTHYLSDHPPFLGSPVDKTGKTIPISCFSTQRIYSVAHVLEESG